MKTNKENPKTFIVGFAMGFVFMRVAHNSSNSMKHKYWYPIGAGVVIGTALSLIEYQSAYK